MKNKNTDSKLIFNKTNIIELSDEQIHKINGGSTNAINIILEATTYGTWLMAL